MTISEVASAAGVSASTASRCFAAPDLVRDNTRQRVLAVAHQLGYAPNRIARSLAGGKTNTIGLVVPDIANLFFATIVKAAETRSRRKDHAVFLADTDEHERDEYELALAMSKQVDGLILVSPRMAEPLLREIAGRLPTVVINRDFEGVPGVLATSADGIRQAVQHLHALGHRHCAHVKGSRNSWSSEQRSIAMQESCHELGLELVEFGPYEPRFSAGVSAADLVHASGSTSVVAHNDLVALGVLSRLAERGISVPGDISVIGVDDTTLASTSSPTLTTVHMPVREFGTHAVDLLFDLLNRSRADDTEWAPHVLLETELVVRRSTGPHQR